jgi:tRNA A64-2'-O-ribosylphosphate transferase
MRPSTGLGAAAAAGGDLRGDAMGMGGAGGLMHIGDGGAPLSVAMVDRRLRQRARQDARNALRSIEADAAFVSAVQSAYPWMPLVANLRAGAWYARPEAWAATSYFKSTDGHTGHWSFSHTRLNLHVAAMAFERGGAMLVDSTKRGKSFPDSFSKTVPIWCAVINNLRCSAGSGAAAVELPDWVSPSEKAQINERLGGWVKEIDVGLRDSIVRLLGSGDAVLPLRPVWICPGPDDAPRAWMPGTETGAREHSHGSHDDDWSMMLPLLDGDGEHTLDYVPIVCVSSSRRVEEDEHREHHSWTYVQGAGDDEEHWAHGLTPAKFWQNKDDLLSAADAEGCIE